MTGSRGIERRVAKLEDAWGIGRVSDDDGQLREAARLVREAQKLAAGNRKPVKGQHSLDLAAAYLLVAGEDKHRQVLSGVVCEGLERWRRIRETGIWVVDGTWWDSREKFTAWVWQAVERAAGKAKPDLDNAAHELAVLRAEVWAFSEPTPPDQLGKDGSPMLLIDDTGPEVPEPPEV
jgi:hypothetical protein